jgi:hypothetical protein
MTFYDFDTTLIITNHKIYYKEENDELVLPILV